MTIRKTEYWKLKRKAPDHTLWKTRFGKGSRSVIREATWWSVSYPTYTAKAQHYYLSLQSGKTSQTGWIQCFCLLQHLALHNSKSFQYFKWISLKSVTEIHNVHLAETAQKRKNYKLWWNSHKTTTPSFFLLLFCCTVSTVEIMKYHMRYGRTVDQQCFKLQQPDNLKIQSDRMLHQAKWQKSPFQVSILLPLHVPAVFLVMA
jgi:hypothetical protein